MLVIQKEVESKKGGSKNYGFKEVFGTKLGSLLIFGLKECYLKMILSPEIIAISFHKTGKELHIFRHFLLSIIPSHQLVIRITERKTILNWSFSTDSERDMNIICSYRTIWCYSCLWRYTTYAHKIISEQICSILKKSNLGVWQTPVPQHPLPLPWIVNSKEHTIAIFA